MLEAFKNPTARAKTIASVVAAIVVAAGTAFGTAKSSVSNPTSLNDGQIAQVRTLISTESPIDSTDAGILRAQLSSVDTKVTNLQVRSAENRILLQEILKLVRPRP